LLGNTDCRTTSVQKKLRYPAGKAGSSRRTPAALCAGARQRAGRGPLVGLLSGLLS